MIKHLLFGLLVAAMAAVIGGAIRWYLDGPYNVFTAIHVAIPMFVGAMIYSKRFLFKR